MRWLSTSPVACDLWEARDQSLFAKLQTYLRHRQLLLLLDNFEQVADDSPRPVELLLACPDLRLLVTSRAKLHHNSRHVEL
jgi:predicted ATPase